MSNLVIDIGNTRTKVAVFDQNTLIYSESSNTLSLDAIDMLLERYSIKKSMISSVAQDEHELANFLQQKSQFYKFHTGILGKVKSYYTSQNTLGLDRWASVLACSVLYPEKNTLIIDAGTCITYDFLNNQNEFMGGNISPGIEMRFQALHQFTGRLPLLHTEHTKEWPQLGTNTESALGSGVYRGVLQEIEGYIHQQNNLFPNTNIVFTGGDSIFLTKQFKNSIFAPQIVHEPHLVLIGLNEAINIANE